MNPRTRLSKSQSRSFVRSRRDRRIWGIGITLVALLAWIFVLSRVSWLGAFAITNVQVYGADPDIAPMLRAAVLGELQGSYLGLFSRADALTYPKQDIAAAVRAASARILTVEIHHTGIHGLSITVTERIPTAIVCAELPDFSTDISNDSNCYFADAQGFIFEQAAASSSLMYERYYEPDLANDSSSNANSNVIVGSYATSTGKFAELQSFFNSVQDAHIHALGILFKDAGEYELYVENPVINQGDTKAAASSTADSNPDIAVVYIHDAGGLSTELSNLVSFWNKEMADGSSPRFESIDVRYAPNVFYRLEK